MAARARRRPSSASRSLPLLTSSSLENLSFHVWISSTTVVHLGEAYRVVWRTTYRVSQPLQSAFESDRGDVHRDWIAPRSWSSQRSWLCCRARQ